MSTRRCIGISYSRYSDPIKQADGDSESRQERMYRDFCERHNLTPLTEVFLDRGKSGYKDEHRKKGRLGVLIQQAKDGIFEPDTVIVVEAWDRLGRLRPDLQIELLKELLRTGVRIGVCQLNDIFSETDFGTHKWISLSTFVMLAYQESKQKAERVAQSWQARRQRARANGGLVTSVLPAWLEYLNGQARLIPERAAVVRRIYQLAAQGYGHGRIIRTLRAEEIPSFTGGEWNTTYIGMILGDRRALGEYQPRKDDGTPEGPPIAKYLPPVVTDKEWLLARAARASRLPKGGKNGDGAARDRKHVNVFRGLLRHARDGGGFFLHNNGRSMMLVNRNATHAKAGWCAFPYAIFENAMLDLLCELKPGDILPKDKEQVSHTDLLKAKLANIRADLAELKTDLLAKYSKTLATVVREKEAEEEEVAVALLEEQARGAQPAERAWRELPSVREMIRKEGDPARLRARTVLGRIVEEIWVLTVKRKTAQWCAVQAFFSGGAQRSFMIYNQAAGYCRKGWWRAGAFARVLAAGDFDLRDHKDAAKLEKLLAGVEISDLEA